jgi:HSP20 family protein
MSILETVPKNGSLAKPRTRTNFPFLSTWLSDMFIEDFPSLLRSDFGGGMTLPKVNIKELEDAFVVEMAIPGFEKSDFDISVENDSLSISAEVETEQADANYIRREFGYSSFRRSFSLPESIQEDKIKARYENGILHLNLPKTPDAIKKPPRRISIS